ncbi:hypothetical protein A343_1074 [Porphyromonas gingivalis JCVI SC001]|nr:hypothetical protein A343_1074 [Porphyromonas gingivalis JCVI SC001]
MAVVQFVLYNGNLFGRYIDERRTFRDVLSNQGIFAPHRAKPSCLHETEKQLK